MALLTASAEGERERERGVGGEISSIGKK